MTAIKAIMSQNGAVTFPPDVRAAAGLENGGPVVIELVDGGLQVRSIKQIMDRAREVARKIVGDQPGFSVDDFLADRRREAEATIFDRSDDEANRLAEAAADADTEAGRVVPHARVREWLKTLGTPDQQPTPMHLRSELLKGGFSANVPSQP